MNMIRSKHLIMSSTNKQGNNYDCGIFVAMEIHQIKKTGDTKHLFGQNSALKFRKYLFHTFAKHHLVSDGEDLSYQVEESNSKTQTESDDNSSAVGSDITHNEQVQTPNKNTTEWRKHAGSTVEAKTFMKNNEELFVNFSHVLCSNQVDEKMLIVLSKIFLPEIYYFHSPEEKKRNRNHALVLPFRHVISKEYDNSVLKKSVQ